MSLGDVPRLMSFEASMEPYAQLVRSLLPRAARAVPVRQHRQAAVVSATSTNPDLFALVLQAIAQLDGAHRFEASDGVGQHCALPDEAPAYLFWLRDERKRCAAVVAVVCNRLATDADVLPFSYVHDHLKPALELLRRDLLARADIEQLNESPERARQGSRAAAVGDRQPSAGQRLGRTAIAAGQCGRASEMRARRHRGAGQGTDAHHGPKAATTTILTRTQRQLLAITQTRRDPLVINRIATQAGQVAIPYRILACPLRQGSGRTSGVLALFRKLDAPEFVGRDVHLADLLARRVAASIETSYDTLSGLLTRAALEQRVKLVFGRPGRAHALEPAVRRHRRAARHQRKLRHARRRPGHRADRRAAAQASAAEFRGRAHLRRPLRGGHALGYRRGGDVRRRPARRRHAPVHRAAWMRVSVCPSAWASRRSTAATASSAVRWPKPSPPARPPRIAAATASRPSRKTTSASSAASPTSTSPPTCARRSRKIACASKRS